MSKRRAWCIAIGVFLLGMAWFFPLWVVPDVWREVVSCLELLGGSVFLGCGCYRSPKDRAEEEGKG